MKKAFVVYNLFLSSIITIVGLFTAQGLTQILISLAFLPVAIYFTIQLFKRPRAPKTPKLYSISPILVNGKEVSMPASRPRLTDSRSDVIHPEVLSPQQSDQKMSALGIKDSNKRIFLKFIGTSSLTMFIFALFSKQAQATFFGSSPTASSLTVKDSSGTVIDPAEKSPTDGYEVTEIDDSGTDTYFGFMDQDGSWYITQESSSGAYRYVRGATDFSTAWTARATQSYDYYDNVF